MALLYQDAAKQKFGNRITVRGDGPLAIRNCGGKQTVVYLFNSEEARQKCAVLWDAEGCPGREKYEFFEPCQGQTGHRKATLEVYTQPTITTGGYDIGYE
jgi:hypothetical protein